MRNASMKVLKNLVCCAAFICLMFVLAMPAHAASKADELLQLVNAERAQAGVAPLSMGSSALNAAAQARAKELTVNYSYNRPNGSREFTILPEYGVDDVSVGENYWAAAENASDVVAAWNRYDFFKERMLDKDATSVGIGYYEGGEYGNYWVMIFTYARGTSENGYAQEVLALVNALMVVFGTFVLLRTALDGNFIAAMLTILGYSINDTVVVYDRIRENRALMGKKGSFEELVNQSVNQSARRTLITTITTVMALGVMCIVAKLYGLDSIFTFAFPLMMGMISGVYTSLCVSTSAWVLWSERSKKKN